ncbi:S46 family peptidase [Lichenicola cladoniae]|uniref:Dipeptidyl-peptidase n=1 Tax=Lichenicola cladoniae TaxID=1484109 RepID=A0A6M8HR71_9PROT|nr:S46 family peptidase [Lichenicola cladoniae]NPD68789.1 S46 family peptidase [Acetobacteraceae bacterium]QKE90790.1 S46 family peptidase [Lichenicola cladoniae]
MRYRTFRLHILRSTTALVLATSTFGAAARADEGMWTMDNLPTRQLKQRYGFTPSAEWISRVTQASARLTLGCSASFVSADGLVMTNHHCANECLAELSPKGENWFQNGFSSKGQASEPQCPAMELDRLDRITDVTATMGKALAGQQGAAYSQAQKAAEAGIQKDCVAGDPTHWRCDVVTLYHGGRTALYRYKRYQDVRLVFAPDQNAAFFGGDPDNFNFPRYDLDLTFLRAYENGHPAKVTYFPFDAEGPKDGQLVFTSGNPGSTSREEPVAQLQLTRDLELPSTYGYLSTLDGVLWQYGRQGAQQTQDAQDMLFGVENSLKVYAGWLQTLADPAMMATKQKYETGLRAWIDADPARKATYGDPWTKLGSALDKERALNVRYTMIEGGPRGNPRGFQSDLFHYAKILVRGAAERAKPDAQRLSAFHDANLPAVEDALKSPAPVHADLDRTLLAFSLTRLRQALGADDATVHQVLGQDSPDIRANTLVDGSKLADPAVRMALWTGGQAAIDASTDPMIVLVRTIEPTARALRDQWDNDIVSVQRQTSETISKARFARDGAGSYPDATFTQRLSFGVVKGWNENGKQVPAFTTFAGLYDRATGSDPFRLTQPWIDAKPHLDMKTKFDFASTNDIIGGNSGSPVIDARGHAVGLIFDGNIHSLGGDFVYDGSQNRAVAVDTSAILAALRTVYKNQAVADELVKGHL